MAPQTSATQVRLNNVSICLTATLKTVELLSESLNTPFLVPISATIRLLLTCVQTVKQHRNECTELLEQTHELLDAIINAHINSDARGELPVTMLKQIGIFTETLHKIHTFVEAQQDGKKLRNLFRHGEMTQLLKECRGGLQQGLDFFKIQTVSLFADITDAQEEAERRYQEVLSLIETLSDPVSSDGASSINQVFLQAYGNSSNSITMLPSEPKIFHGREAELSAILKTFGQGIPRVAILGAGGIGKTSLARAVLHHPEITSRYGQSRFFVACDSAATQVELAALVGAHLGLRPGKDLTQPVVRYFRSSQPSLLILDNLETLWENTTTRKEVEEFLALLADVANLAVIITMRGAERPAKVQWSRPFLGPLKPLEQDAARKTFMDITDDEYNIDDIDKVLALSDNMPLAIDLLAHLVESEGCSNVLSRWDAEKTSLISQGYDRSSNLEMSISMSLSSPRISLLPNSQDLLSLLSMLPNGLSDVELAQSKLPFKDIWECKDALLRTSLAYNDEQQRLKTMVPIREYMQKYHPPGMKLIRPLLHYFHQLLDFNQEYGGTQANSRMVSRLLSNLANIHNVLKSGLQGDEHTDLVDSIYCTCYLNQFSRQNGRGKIPLIHQAVELLPSLSNPHLEVYLITEVFGSWQFYRMANPDGLITRASERMNQFNDTDLKCKFYNAMAYYYQGPTTAIDSCRTALSLAISTGNNGRHSDTLRRWAYINLKMGNALEGQVLAQESQRMAKLSGDLWQEAVALRIGAMCNTTLGNYKASLVQCSTARALLRICGLAGCELDRAILSTQSEVHFQRSEYIETRGILTQILREASVEQDPYNHAMTLYNLATTDVNLPGPLEDSKNKINTAKSLFASMGETVHEMGCDTVLADILLREGDLLSAKKMLYRILKDSYGNENRTANTCLEMLADVRRWGVLQFPAWTTIFLIQSLKSKQRLETNKALQYLGDLFFSEGDEDTAATLLTVALDGFTCMDVHRSRAECICRLGEILEKRGDLSRAVELWHAARPLFERSSQEEQLRGIDRKIASITDN